MKANEFNEFSTRWNRSSIFLLDGMEYIFLCLYRNLIFTYKEMC